MEYSRLFLSFFAFILLITNVRGALRGLKTGGTKECSAPSVADVLILGGTIVTMNEEQEIIEPGGIAIVGSELVYVGSEDEASALYCANKVLQVEENDIIMPGLINGHTHTPMTLLRSIAGDNLPLQEWLNNFIFPAEAATVNPDFVKAGAALAAMEMLSTGTTTYADMYYFEQEHAETIEKIGMRAILGQAVIGFPVADAPTPQDALELCRTFLENWQGHPLITAAVAPHAPYTLSMENLNASATLAREFGAPIHIHVSETQVEVDTVMNFTNGLTPFEYLDSFGFLGPDVIAAHSIVLSENDLDILLSTRTGTVHNPESNMKLASGIMPIPDLIEKGIKLGLGTDGPASNDDLDMFEALLITPLLQKVSNLEPTILSAGPVLTMATIGGARAVGMEDKIGSLEVGKEADLIVVNGNSPHMVPRYDLVSLLVYNAKGSDVLMTMVAGKVLYKDGEFMTLDAEQVLTDARAQGEIVKAAVGI